MSLKYPPLHFTLNVSSAFDFNPTIRVRAFAPARTLKADALPLIQPAVDDDEGSLQITVTRTLEMRPVIVNILNTAITMDKPLILMHSALDVMYQQPENASIQDHWDQDEEELYANNSVLSLYLRPEQDYDLYC
ncbi:hypothetical protein EV421DRAFT_1899787 [Armillaria borealis]|uniref:Uncharacterized protein n=1 Tax=Armillaria borealis TaxID=47425 RepID=A0AA39JWL7_9AGAR|nr:hypothetical protein EV421DRAFT_1899787 [Armillaria borealis]